MNIINLTKHTVNIFDNDNNEIIAIQPSGLEARIKTEFQNCGNFSVGDGTIPVYKTIVIGTPYCTDDDGNECPLPKSKSNTVYVVSGAFRQHFDRHDLFQPGRLLRNEAGQPIGCIGLSR